ncbi:MAG: S1 RNA-binding domain-containing protein [Bryobacterales bacterium]|nr:S1 RNA-binding domain-containing protein [Bryobacterales bacterium]MDE0292677.1 S1 RNA-binding domain-containing protein [Bryobacterales bacterium]
MKSLTGLPPSAYLKITEEAKIPLVVLERLVQELEAGSTPAYISHYRQDVSGGLDEQRIRLVENRLKQFLRLEDLRIAVLSSASRQGRLTPELREQCESATDRWELEDLYLPFKQKQESPADTARKQGLEGLASRLEAQKPEDQDVKALAAEYLNEKAGIKTTADALRGAREIIAQSWSEDVTVRRGLRRLLRQRARLVVHDGQSVRGAAKGKYKNLLGYQARCSKVAWRQMMALRRAVHEIGLRFEIKLPANKVVSFLLETKGASGSPQVQLQLGAVAARAFEGYIAPSFAKEELQVLNERCDREAVEAFQKNLRKILMTPPAGRIGVVGLETGRPGGWRAAVINPDGEFVEGAVIHRDGGLQGVSVEDPPVLTESEKGDAGTASGGPTEEKTRSTTPEKSSSTTQSQNGNAAAKQEIQPGDQPDQPAATNGSVSAAAPESLEAGSKSIEPVDGQPASTADSTTDRSAEEPVPESLPGKPLASSNGDGSRESVAPLVELLRRNEVNAIVMSTGPGVRQVERLVRSSIREAGCKDIFWTTVNEAGSWIYATSKAARRDMPNASVAQRGAACLAKRLQDPLAAFAHVDPRTLGLGQFHQSIDAHKLREGLRTTLESTVHVVGIDLNTAPVDLIALTPGMTDRLAKRVVEHRLKKGRFTKREQLNAVSGLSKRIYKQVVGFTRVFKGEIPLDATGIHPDQYPITERILAAAGVSASEALEKPEVLDSVALEEYQSPEFPLAVLQGIVQQLRPSVRNPRGDFVRPSREVELRTDEELATGKKVEGVVTNIAAFGAFVDIGADQDGLVHISRMSDKFVKDPNAAVKVGDRVEVYVLALEDGGKRISLSMRDPAAAATQRPGRTRVDARKASDAPRRRRPKEARREAKMIRRSFGPSGKEKLREERDMKKLSLDEKLALLQTKYRTKV